MTRDTATTAMIQNERERLLSFKKDVSSIFTEMGNYMLTTSNKMNSFKEIIAPYIRYFYPSEPEKAEESFAKDVIIPSRKEMEDAIDQAVSTMRGDDRINNRISSAIQRTLDIRQSVDEILNMIEAIDIYSVNTMLISTKAGTEGETLTKISYEMSSLSNRAGTIATNFMGLIENLENSHKEFNTIREQIDIVNENYLTQMKIKSRMIFGEIISDLKHLSSNVTEIMEYSGELEGSIRNVMDWLQTEDLMRQDLEKVIFSLEEMDESEGELINSMSASFSKEKLHDFFRLMTRSKIITIENHMTQLISGSNECGTKIKEILNRFLGKFYGTDGDGKDYYEGEKLETVYKKLEDMKNEYIEYIENIIQGKEKLYNLSSSILAIIRQFSIFFNDLVQVAKRFEIINMLTKIELARHSELRKTLAGALTGVKDLPTQMKKIIENSVVMNSDMSSHMETAIAEYHTSFKIQETTLHSCIQAMKKISLKLNESKKYYADISEEIGGTCTNMLGFIENENSELENLEDLRIVLSQVSDALREGNEDIPDSRLFLDEGNATRSYLKERPDFDDYRNRVLYSLISEFLHDEAEERVYIF
ncbi:MAG TPA: hypothetical protein PK253_06205 [Spirochaetota bacterium]|nr:hypothetical protein [Spirochaetota bacterium]